MSVMLRPYQVGILKMKEKLSIDISEGHFLTLPLLNPSLLRRGKYKAILLKSSVILSLCFFLPTNTKAATGVAETIHDEHGNFDIHIFARGFSQPSSGFYPIQVEIENRGKTRTFEAYSKNGSLSARQKVQLAAGERGRLLVLYPVVAIEAAPYLFGYSVPHIEFLVDGKKLGNSARNIPFQTGIRMVNIWWVGNLDGTSLDIVADALSKRWGIGASAAGSYAGSTTTPLDKAKEQFVALSPNEIPTSWLGLTSGDILVCPWSTLNELESDRRVAIIEWVESGGTLVVSEAPSFEEASSLWRQWSGGSLRKNLGWGANGVLQWTAQDLTGEIYALTQDSTVPTGLANTVATWFQRVRPAKGTCLYADVGDSSSTRTLKRPGTTPSGQSCLEENEVPKILKKSVSAIIILLAMWVILIFPFQYLWLKRKRRLGWLPFCTFTSSIGWMFLMTNYGILTQGIGIRSIDRTCTWLDQSSHRAVVTGFTAFASGFSHPGGFPLPEGGWLLPSPPPGIQRYYGDASESKNFVYNWNAPARLEGDWFAPRTLSCLEMHQVIILRQRLEIDLDKEGQMKVINGLGANIDFLRVYNEDHKQVWELRSSHISPGDHSVLAPLDDPKNLIVQKTVNAESFFGFEQMIGPFEHTRVFIARIGRPGWVNFGFNSKNEEGTQHWVIGTW